MLKKRQNKLLKLEFYSIKEPKNIRYKFVNYTSKWSYNVCNRINRLVCKTISVNKQNLGWILINNKGKIDKMHKSGVYKINCKDCPAVYVGQSGRNIETRVKEHKRSILNNIRNTGMSTHCIDNNHFIDLDNVQLLHTESKSKRLNLLEQLEIKKSINNNRHFNMNDQQNYINTPVIDKCILSSLPGPSHNNLL